MTPDLLILGAGPAGMAAASEARLRGLSVLLLDENGAPGGQVHRGVTAGALASGPGAKAAEEGRALARALTESGAEVRLGATLWAIEEDGGVCWSEGGRAVRARPGRVLLCPGATERPLPVPGWTLPGVMGVGAAQILLKTAGLVPEGRVWVAGQGPLLWLYAAQVIAKGGRLAGVLDMSRRSAWAAASLRLPLALTRPGYLRDGFAWMRAVRSAGIPVIRARDVRAIGEGRLRSVRFDGRDEAADLLLLHDGVVPNTQITRALQGCAHQWDRGGRCWRPTLDTWGNTTVPFVMVTGDGGGIGGARVAALSGRIAALEAARALGRLSAEQRDALAGPILQQREAELAPRPFLEALYPPLPLSELPDDTVLCRCEEVRAGQVRQAAKLGAQGPNQLKSFWRAGMGPCQGRVCGPAVHAVMAEALGHAPGGVAPLRTRFPTKPVTVGALASLHR